MIMNFFYIMPTCIIGRSSSISANPAPSRHPDHVSLAKTVPITLVYILMIVDITARWDYTGNTQVRWNT